MDHDNSMAKTRLCTRIFPIEPANTPVIQVEEGEELCSVGMELSKARITAENQS
jgi:hypothetical protein